MVARLAFVLLALVAGCKGMGGLGSGLGHIVSGAGHVAGSVGRVTETLGRAAPIVARSAVVVASHTLPIAEDIAEAAVLGADATEPVEVQVQVRSPQDGPLIANHDPCAECPVDLDCNSCIGYGDAACRLTPAGAFARCESQLP